MRYTFGNTSIAARRVELIARYFNPLAIKFITEHMNNNISTAIDLGCGPGCSTEMLSTATDCENVYGFDNSDYFIQIAQKSYRHLNFINHDVAKIPFPVMADIMYVRFLLSHLNKIENIIANWIKQLKPGGMLFIEEVEDIFTNVSVFKKYLKINSGLIKDQGAELFAGKLLGNATVKFNTIFEDSVDLHVYNWQAAGWFYPNTISVWDSEEYILNKLNNNERKQISEELFDMKSKIDNSSEITWRMKRIIVKN